MKAMIREDDHSLYVRTNGRVYRPVRTKHSLVHPLSVGMGNGTYYVRNVTLYTAFESVRVSPVAGTTALHVRGDGMEEFWHSHGEYLGKKTKDCWEPVA